MRLFAQQRFTVLLTCVVVLLAGVVCGGGGRPSALVGHWVHLSGPTSGKPETLELFKDGTGVVDGERSVTWKVENKRFVMQSSVKGTACGYSVSGSKLTLVYDNEDSVVFAKKADYETLKKQEEEIAEKKREEEAIAEKKRLEELKMIAISGKEGRRKKFEAISSYVTDTRDGQKYRAVKIGNAMWMAENLNYATSSGSWCYDSDNSYCDAYGRLYDWNTANTACPSGWRLPTGAEWSALVEVAGGKEAGRALKSASGWDGTDNFGFSALPGGTGTGGSCCYVGYNGSWWTASGYQGGVTYYRLMGFDIVRVGDPNYSVRREGFSVRCVGD